MDDQDKDDLRTFRLQDIFDKRYAKRGEVALIRAIVFGAVGLILSSVMVGIMAWLIAKPPTTSVQIPVHSVAP